jgi:hypothetical protein
MAGNNKLTTIQIESLTQTGGYADGGGLYLQVSRWGSKSSLFRHMREGKALATGLGSPETVGPAEAREKARHARQLLAQGIDRIGQQNATQQHQAANARTFREAAVA